MSSTTSHRYRIETYSAIRGAAGNLYRLCDNEAGVRFSVAPFAGAEIASIQTRSNGEWLEILERAEDFTPCDRWRGRAPWLWPVVGRSYSAKKLEDALRTGRLPTEFDWDCEGKIYPMPMHGFAMRRAWIVTTSRTSDEGARVECTLADDEDTRKQYPFGFLANLSFRLSDGIVRAIYRVEAAKSNSAPMPFCAGNHITLRAPLTAAGRFEDVRVFAPVRHVYAVTSLGLVNESAELSFREGILLADSRLHNLVVGHFAPEQASVRVSDPGGLQIEIGQRELVEAGSAKAPSDGFYFVFYASPKHGFFCPEPWLGLPNALNTLRPIVALRPGDHFEWEVTVRINHSTTLVGPI
jgi:galactose mutarotase-like enzyme